MLRAEDILNRVNRTVVNNPILDTRINSVQIETLALVLIDYINAEITKICEDNNLNLPL